MPLSSYKDLLHFSSQIKIEDQPLSYILEDQRIINNQPFIAKHKLFYPKGVFSGKYLIEYFFADDSIHAIEFSKDLIAIKTINLDQITSVNLDIHGYKDYTLLIKFKNNDDISLKAKEDSNEHHMQSFSENIEDIHKYLLTGKFDRPAGISSTNPW